MKTIYKFDEPDASTLYIGEAATNIGASEPFWSIRKLSKSGTETTILYADGNDSFDNIWNDRVTLNYS